jgi:hypothetical protein
MSENLGYLRGIATDSVEIFYSLQCINNVFLIIRQIMPVSYEKLKERYKPQMLYYENMG